MFFVSPLKLFSFSRYLTFCCDFLVMQKNSLIRKMRLISKFMTSQPWKQTIAMHLLPNTSRSKGNQTMRLDQLIRHNIRNIFLENSYRKCGRETIPRRFSEKPKLSISLDHQSKVLYSLYLSYAKLRAIKIILKLRCRPPAITLYKAFLKSKKGSGTSPFIFHFLHVF